MASKAKSGPGGAQRKGKSAEGRAAKGPSQRVGRPSSPEEQGRYTPPTPRSVRRSPRWFGALTLGLMLVGVLIILLNYLSVLPTVSAWYLLVGLVLIFAGFMMATRYR
jgi:hypothetical protein